MTASLLMGRGVATSKDWSGPDGLEDALLGSAGALGSGVGVRSGSVALAMRRLAFARREVALARVRPTREGIT